MQQLQLDDHHHDQPEHSVGPEQCDKFTAVVQQSNSVIDSTLHQCGSAGQNENGDADDPTATGEPPAAATEDGKQKLNQEFKNQLEQNVLNKESSDQQCPLNAFTLAETPEATVTTKLSNATSTTNVVSTGSTGGLAANPTQHQDTPQTVELQQQQHRHQENHIAVQDASKEEGATTPSHTLVQIECPEIPWTSWPHLELATILHQDDINLTCADICSCRIAYMASQKNVWREKMIHDGVSQTLVSLLCHPNASLEMRQNTIFAFAELAMSQTGEQALVTAGAIPLLVWFLNMNNHSDLILFLSSCRALRNLLSYGEHTAVLAARYGCVDPLLNALAVVSGHQKTHSGGDGRNLGMDADVAIEALAAVSNLVGHGKKFQSYVLVKHGGLAILVALGCTSDTDQVLFHVIRIMANCARESRWHKAIINRGGLRVALHALRSAHSPEVRAEAARLVGNIAVTSKGCVAAREHGVVTAMIDLLLDQYPLTTVSTNTITTCSPSNGDSQQQENTPRNTQGDHRATDMPSSSSLPKAVKSPLLALDLLCALTNSCATDPRTAAEIVERDGAVGTVLALYTADGAPEALVKELFSTLLVLAHGSAARRARVLYDIGVQLKQVKGMDDMYPKRLYDLRQAILEQVESQ